MKIKAKLMLLALSAGSFALGLFGWGGGCARFWGDLVGDEIWLRGID